MNNKFAYVDESDKCYGLTGMILSLNVFDSESMLKSVDIDNTEGEYICFTPEFYFHANPRFSAKTAWNEMVRQYQLYTAMIVGNVMCRYAVGWHKPITRDMMRELHRLVEEEGHDICSLDDDEIDMIFNKTTNYLSSLYTNRQVYSMALHLVDALRSRRCLSGSEIVDELRK